MMNQQRFLISFTVFLFIAVTCVAQRDFTNGSIYLPEKNNERLGKAALIMKEEIPVRF
jgi:hypothetical protein